MPNGYVNGSGSVEGSYYRFSCKEGFSLEGEDRLNCTGDGKWSDSVPVCRRGNNYVIVTTFS